VLLLTTQVSSDILLVGVLRSRDRGSAKQGDHIRSRRTSLLLALASFVCATVMIWVARHIAVMIIGRFLQGVASAAVWAVGLALLVDTVGRHQVPVAMGYVNIGFGCGSVLGPLIGGLVYSFGGFHATMGVAIGLLVLDIVLRLLIVEKKDVDALTRRLAPRAENSSVSPLLGERSRIPGAEEDPRGNAPAESAYRTLIQSRRLVVTLSLAVVQALTMAAFETTLPLHLYRTFRYSAFQIALVLMPLMVPAFLSPLIGTSPTPSNPQVRAQTPRKPMRPCRQPARGLYGLRGVCGHDGTLTVPDQERHDP
jgi:MFS family permease